MGAWKAGIPPSATTTAQCSLANAKWFRYINFCVTTQQLHEVPTITIHFTDEDIETVTCNLPKDIGKHGLSNCKREMHMLALHLT